MDWTAAHPKPVSFSIWVRVRFLPWICGMVFLVAATGCAHYPINQPSKQSDPQGGYRAKNFKHMGTNNDMLVMLTFSGGGTRAAAFSYGVLEALRDTEISIHGSKKRMLDAVDFISGVSGGSFTAAYYGLFGDRIFEDFESRFLKKNIQGEIIRGTLFNPVNWAKLSSPYYGRSDLAADYYDKYVFDHATFGDILAHGGPMVVINATDMTLGTRFSFIQDPFDAICSDLCSFSVARACAASSAVPVVLSPVTLRNYAGTCGFQLPRHSLMPCSHQGRLRRADPILPITCFHSWIRKRNRTSTSLTGGCLPARRRGRGTCRPLPAGDERCWGCRARGIPPGEAHGSAVTNGSGKQTKAGFGIGSPSTTAGITTGSPRRLRQVALGLVPAAALEVTSEPPPIRPLSQPRSKPVRLYMASGRWRTRT